MTLRTHLRCAPAKFVRLIIRAAGLVFIFLVVSHQIVLLPAQAATFEPISFRPNLTPISALANPTNVTLVPFGATWSFLDDGSDQGAAWSGLAFDDSLWASGPAKLGYGNGDEDTEISYGPDPNNKHITTYFRYSFDVIEASVYNSLLLMFLRDDGVVVYLNGSEVFRSNMPSGVITYTTTASSVVAPPDESTYFSAIIDPAKLVNGTNVIAVELHQVSGSSSDISFDLELTGITGTAVCSQSAVRFAVIGDYGQASQPELNVSNLVKSWNPDFIITVGDNNYPSGAAGTIDQNIGQYYHEFIGSYTGSYGPGAISNNFYPALGNHDWITQSGSPPLPQPYLNYFTLPGNERYYTFARGPIEFFVVDSDPNEPDGRSSTSIQAKWLQDRLPAARAPWKLIYMHHPPYSSSSVHGSETVMQWPYQAWGATAVLAGHDHTYERIIGDGFPYFVNGLGGNSLYTFGTPISGSVFRYNNDYGAMLIEAAQNCITFQFIPLTGTIVDSYTLSYEPAINIDTSLSLYLPVIVSK